MRKFRSYLLACTLSLLLGFVLGLYCSVVPRHIEYPGTTTAQDATVISSVKLGPTWSLLFVNYMISGRKAFFIVPNVFPVPIPDSRILVDPVGEVSPGMWIIKYVGI